MRSMKINSKKSKNIKTNKIKIFYVNDNNYSFDFNEVFLIRKIVRETLIVENINYDVSLSVLLVSSKKIKYINSSERNVDAITDVLSFPNISFDKVSDFDKFKTSALYKSIKVFPYALDPFILDFNTKTVFLGDIVLCYDKIIAQANEYNHSIKREFAFLVLHSLLHLLGYDHIKVSDEKKMFDKQKYILNELKIIK